MKCTIFKTFVNLKFILQYLNYNIHVLLLVQIPFLEFISYNVPTSYYFIPNSQHCATVIFVQYIICKPQFCIYYLVKVPNMFELSTVTSKINYSWPSNLYTIAYCGNVRIIFLDHITSSLGLETSTHEIIVWKILWPVRHCPSAKLYIRYHYEIGYIYRCQIRCIYAICV